jgi:hypothetical protein
MEFCFAAIHRAFFPSSTKLSPLPSVRKRRLHTRLEAMFALMSGLLFRFLGASPLRGVGLSAPIYFAALRKFRFNPLRFAHC